MQNAPLDGKSFMRLSERRLNPSEVTANNKLKISITSDLDELYDYANGYCRDNNPYSAYAADMMSLVHTRARELREKMVSLGGPLSPLVPVLAIDKLDEILALA